MTHARFTLASAFATGGSHRRTVEEAATARVETSAKGFGFLAALFPGLGFSYAGRIYAGLLGYALGDAIGLPWEGSTPAEIDLGRVPNLPQARDWSRGSTSDDTAVTLVTAEHLVAGGGGDATRLMERLAAQPSIKGLVPRRETRSSTSGERERSRQSVGTPTARSCGRYRSGGPFR